MNKKIEDYLPYYLGCEIRMYNPVTNEYSKWRKLTPTDYNLVKSYGRRIQLRLNQLSFISEDENILEEICIAIRVEPHLFYQAYADLLLILSKGNFDDTSLYISAFEMAEITRILCKHEIDLFGLIDAGLAIDKTSTK